MRRMTPNTTVAPTPLSEEGLSIGERFRVNLKRLMAEQNLSQAALADRLTLMGEPTNSDNVRMLLKSASFPSSKWIELMARALGVSESELLTEIFSSE